MFRLALLDFNSWLHAQGLIPYSYKGFRVDSLGRLRNASVLDAINYELHVLGNDEYSHLGEPLLLLLGEVPSRCVVWVTSTEDDALIYGEGVFEVDLGSHPMIITEDDDSGFLVLKSEGVDMLQKLWK